MPNLTFSSSLQQDLFLSSILVSLLKEGSQVTSAGISLLGCQVAESTLYLPEQGLQLTDLWHVEILINTDKGESFQIESLCVYRKWEMGPAESSGPPKPPHE